jgi:hypothetical protein
MVVLPVFDAADEVLQIFTVDDVGKLARRPVCDRFTVVAIRKREVETLCGRVDFGHDEVTPGSDFGAIPTMRATKSSARGCGKALVACDSRVWSCARAMVNSPRWGGLAGMITR